MIIRVPTTNDAVGCAPVSCGADVHNLRLEDSILVLRSRTQCPKVYIGGFGGTVRSPTQARFQGAAVG
jgi:hypothetical protein